jgi:4-hydroxy-3-methylbut-2-enyl diphosphate reductase
MDRAPETEQVPDTVKPSLTIHLAAPRGYCAGVERAIQVVERALERFGTPVYVRHEIVHNRTVVEDLAARGAVFVEELAEVPDGAPVVLSAHGVAKDVYDEADARKLFYLDATGPLVSKVHREAEQAHAAGHEILLIGHAGHPEVIGTLGQLPPGSIRLIESEAQARDVTVADPERLAYLTQTTLSIDETADILAILKSRFPGIQEPRKEDICYATTNRQRAVRAIVGLCDGFLVIGAPNSSNSVRLVEAAQRAGAGFALLVQGAGDVPWSRIEGDLTIGISAGASAPEKLVLEVLDALSARFETRIEEDPVAQENIVFKLPTAVGG